MKRETLVKKKGILRMSLNPIKIENSNVFAFAKYYLNILLSIPTIKLWQLHWINFTIPILIKRTISLLIHFITDFFDVIKTRFFRRKTRGHIPFEQRWW